MSQIWKWPLWTSWLILYHRKPIRHFNEKFAIPSILTEWHDHNTWQIGLNVCLPVPLLTKVPYEMKTIVLHLTEDIKQKCLDGVENILVIQEHPWDITKVFTVSTLIKRGNFKKWKSVFPPDLVTRWMSDVAFHGMSDEFLFVNAEEKTEVADIETFTVELLGKWCEIPCLEPMPAKLYGLNSFHFGLFNEVFDIFFSHSMMLIVVQELPLIVPISLFFIFWDFLLLFVDLIRVYLQELLWDPSIVSSIDSKVMNIILVPHALFEIIFIFIVQPTNLLLTIIVQSVVFR